MNFFERMPLKSSLIVVKNAPILLAQQETGHMSVALMPGRQAKQSPNPNIHFMSKPRVLLFDYQTVKICIKRLKMYKWVAFV